MNEAKGREGEKKEVAKGAFQIQKHFCSILFGNCILRKVEVQANFVVLGVT